MYDVKESDWKLLRKLVPGWQERYMDKLNKEYIEILRRYNASISTKQMDFENFVIVKNPNKEDLL